MFSFKKTSGVIAQIFEPTLTKVLFATLFSLPFLMILTIVYSSLSKVRFYRTIFISLLGFLFLYLIICLYFYTKDKKLKSWATSLGVLGIILLLINFVGLFSSLRNPKIYQADTYFKNDITLSKKQFYANIQRQGETDAEYIEKITQTINSGMAHYKDEPNEFKKYNLQLPIFENYLLASFAYLVPKKYRAYEFCDYKKAMERGIGQCGQHAVIASEIFRLNGIDAKILYLNRLHVINTVQADKKNNIWWIVDTDFNVIIKHNFKKIENNPEYIIEAYSQKGYQENVDYLLKAYLGHNEKYGKVMIQYDDVKKYCGAKYYIESISYILIWAIPLFLIFPWLSSRLKK